MMHSYPVRASLAILTSALILSGCASSAGQSGQRSVDINLVALNDFHGNLEASKYSYAPAGSAQKTTIQAGGIDQLGGA
jgi:5'-nucleotidase